MATSAEKLRAYRGPASFTRNWLAKAAPGTLPAPFGKFDIAVIAASAFALLAWVAMPEGAVTAAA
jgi:uncharacterized protein involved in response to NO